MKKQDVQKKQFRQLSDEELKQVTGGMTGGAELAQEWCYYKTQLGGVCPTGFTEQGEKCCCYQEGAPRLILDN